MRTVHPKRKHGKHSKKLTGMQDRYSFTAKLNCIWRTVEHGTLGTWWRLGITSVFAKNEIRKSLDNRPISPRPTTNQIWSVLWTIHQQYVAITTTMDWWSPSSTMSSDLTSERNDHNIHVNRYGQNGGEVERTKINICDGVHLRCCGEKLRMYSSSSQWAKNRPASELWNCTGTQTHGLMCKQGHIRVLCTPFMIDITRWTYNGPLKHLIKSPIHTSNYLVQLFPL